MNQKRQAHQTKFMLNSTPRVNQSGDDGVSKLTLRTLFDSEETALLRYAFSLVGRRAVAEEIVQSVFLQLHAQWDDVESPRAWLFRSVRNRAYNYVRDNKREIIGRGDDDVQDRVSDQPTSDEVMAHMETLSSIRQVVEDLDERDRQLVKMKYFDNLKYRDISTQTGLSVSNVGYRLHHILKEMSRKLRSLGIDGKS